MADRRATRAARYVTARPTGKLTRPVHSTNSPRGSERSFVGLARPVVVVTHSQGAWIALVRDRRSPSTCRRRTGHARPLQSRAGALPAAGLRPSRSRRRSSRPRRHRSRTSHRHQPIRPRRPTRAGAARNARRRGTTRVAPPPPVRARRCDPRPRGSAARTETLAPPARRSVPGLADPRRAPDLVPSHDVHQRLPRRAGPPAVPSLDRHARPRERRLRRTPGSRAGQRQSPVSAQTETTTFSRARPSCRYRMASGTSRGG